ncbi:YifB family Mg chelatase-like AAA ATPase [Cellulosilyticum sp. I15G10I2]|uniref:YifB family Mg chelatase-like AAA ATPase n=1 Tax=Cellulosilyticum sp. I15G10I2 TaxID=1892843 RepID=UPI00085C9646|nr:YifB family Mg chelatase-like AAA ATPase [Cellulosilyticum sp. I15G10I2]
MFCKLNSYSLNGVNTIHVDVEVDICDGLPGFEIVGLPDSAVRESRERVKSAIKNSGFKFPMRKITINLAPADVKKEGSLYDLPIALGILCCMGEIPISALQNSVYIGELALNGNLRGVRGLLPILCSVSENPELNCIVPYDNSQEASLIQKGTLFLAHSLQEVVAFTKNEQALSKCSNPPLTADDIYDIDFADVKGQESVKRGLMICAAGYHNALLIGPPGSGKTMLANRLISILPPLTDDECIEITKIYSIANKLSNYAIIQARPFRTPHHTISPLGLTGGGLHPKPGEISLSHLGVLFLDELLEFNKGALEVLRQPLEEHRVTIARANSAVTYPSNFLFIASTNPCPCGYYPNTKKCSCSINSIKKYLSKLSGPLLDRIDVHLETQSPTINDLNATHTLSSKELYNKVKIALSIQEERFKDTDILYNSQIPASKLSKYCSLTHDAHDLLNSWFENSSSSVRAYDKILRLALTVADLTESSQIDIPHISEAIQYRLLDRKFWA